MSKMAHVFAAALMAATVAGPAAGAKEPVTPETLRSFRLSEASSSREDLLQRFLEALRKKDVAALDRLRVTEAEYRDFFIPASVKEGQALQEPSERASKFYWSMLNTRSMYAADAMLRGFGGRTYTLKGVEYDKSARTYAFYRADRAPVLSLEDEQGKETEIKTGSIVEVNGQFKFMSFQGE
jgi:hypothetical protein